jgi:hypothetical protein
MRHLKKLHPLSWFALFLSASALLLIVVPGLPVEGSAKLRFPATNQRKTTIGSIAGGPPQYVRDFEHGWPFTFAHRAFGYSIRGNSALWSRIPPSPNRNGLILFEESALGGSMVAGYEISWTAPNAWPWVASDLSEFHPLLAAFDLLIALAIVGLIVAITETWRRRRGAIWRWRVIDIVAALSFVAIALGYWRWGTSARDRDAKLIPLAAADGDPSKSFYWRYRGPGWLPHLLGTRRPLTCFSRIVELRSSMIEGTPDRWKAIGGLTALERLDIDGWHPSETEFNELIGLRKLRNLAWRRPSSDALQWLPRLEQVKTVSLYACKLPDSEIEALRQTMPWAEITTRRL